MAWGKKDEELPERLRGKTPAEIDAMLADAEANKSKVATLEGQLQETTSKFETFGQTLTTLNERIEKLSVNGGERRQEPPKGDAERPEPASFLTEPDRAFAERAAPIVGLVLNASAQLARENALRRAMNRQKTVKNNIDGVIFDKYGTEVDELAKGCSPQQLAMPETWEHLFFNVKGRHADEIATHNREHAGEFFVEDAQRRDGSNDGGNQHATKLTPLEEKVAKKMGVTPEAYLKQRNGMGTGIPEELIA